MPSPLDVILDQLIPDENATIIRQSIINKMQLCPAIQGYSDKEGFIEPLGESLLFGDSLHYLAETVMQGIEPKMAMDSFDEWAAIQLAVEYDWDIARIPKYSENRKEIFDAFRLWIFQVYQPYLSKLKQYYVEAELYRPLSLEENIWLKGTPDLGVLGSGLYDYKTAKSNKQWSQAKADLALQASLYLGLHNYVLSDSVSKFTFIVYNRQAAEWNLLPTSRTETEITAANATALMYGRQLKAQAFPATPVVSEFMKRKRGWYCSARWCGAWNICEHKFMNDSVDESVVAEREWM